MNQRNHLVTLSNGEGVRHSYVVKAFNTTEAVILAQAEAIRMGRGYNFVAVV